MDTPNSRERRRLKRQRIFAPPGGELIRSGDAFIRLRPTPRSRPEEARQIIIENSLWFSSVKSQDDWFEGRPRFAWPQEAVTYQQILELARRHCRSQVAAQREADRIFAEIQDPRVLAERKAKLQAEHENLYAESSIASFFRNPLIAGHWAQYASRGQGYGLVFNLALPWTFVGARGEPPSRWAPFPVSYVAPTQRPCLHLQIGPSNPTAAFEELRGALLTKSSEWSNQREARFIRVGVPAGLVTFPPTSLRALVLGYDMDEVDKRTMLDLTAQRPEKLEIYQSRHSQEHYALELERIA